MSEPEKTAEKKRHYIPVLPQPRPDTLQNSAAATKRATRNKLIAKKLDQILGSIDEDY